MEDHPWKSVLTLLFFVHPQVIVDSWTTSNWRVHFPHINQQGQIADRSNNTMLDLKDVKKIAYDALWLVSWMGNGWARIGRRSGNLTWP
ncbi:MAG: hypothetical protein J3Q66DRAFT_57922 [Benniella sp.]|nr:MAG: hypothetical protein J3Q66DRAFT_57922 [Benniella sp.]